jgi:hypothetical protein
MWEAVQSDLMLPECVEMVQQKLPMSLEFLESTFYVRSCYEEYYQLVMELLLKPRMNYITLTGTPGIGKSIFYIYFFQRYQRENPTATIVTASFGQDRKLGECVVFEPGKVQGVEYEKIPKFKGSIHLYDGPPENSPPRNKMVCFTSPNNSWLDQIFKYPNHIPLYLPVWNLQELCDANDSLELGLDSRTIKERFLFFGGSARYCLAFDVDFCNRGVEEIRRKATSIQSFTDIRRCLLMTPDKADISHQIFHYVPLHVDNFPHLFDLEFCSNRVAKLVHIGILDKSETKRKELADWIKLMKYYSTLLGWLIEGYPTNS